MFCDNLAPVGDNKQQKYDGADICTNICYVCAHSLDKFWRIDRF